MVILVLFSDINPYVRYARVLELTPRAHFSPVVAPDARLLYTLLGKGCITAGGRDYAMSENSLIIIGAGVPYHIQAPVSAVKYLAFNFDYTRRASHLSVPIQPCGVSEFQEEMCIDPVDIEDNGAFGEVLYLEKITTVGKKLSSVVAEYAKKRLYSEVKTGHMLAECLAECAGYSTSFSGEENEITDAVISYIHENVGQPLSNKALGEAFDYHPNYISFLVKKATGMPLHRYLLHVRLSKAVQLLENSSLPIGEIATGCGFCDAAHFSGCFKRHFGVSPSNYRSV